MNSQRLKLTSNGSSFHLDLDSLRKAARRLRLINHPASRTLLEIITINPGLTLNEICLRCSLDASLVNSHLNLLANNSIIKKRCDGSDLFYTLDEGGLSRITEGIQVISGFVFNDRTTG